ncbi:CWC16 protein [Biscogniauxia sp. FL1348]|nr:CWC16 protein [Biscogniauxia sp. FL1348]
MQGFNMGRYVPPDVEGTTTGNRLHRRHPLGRRAFKLRTHGALTVRFEMPFGVWCGTCTAPTLIAQGVRFNAEKRCVGYYYTTPIFSFRLRHTACGGAIEIRTDPANTAYVVVEGGKRRDTGQDNNGSNGMVADPIRTDAEHASLRASAFARLEKTIADRAAVEGARNRIHTLEEASARRWEDPYARNRRLRDAFRVERKQREGEARGAEELAERMGLGFEILPATKEDARRAALVDFGASEGTGEMMDGALMKPLFGRAEQKQEGWGQEKPKALPSTGDADKAAQAKTKNRRLKSEIAAARTRENLVSVLVGNTRATQDPFLSSSAAATIIPGIKRKRKESSAGDTRIETAKEEEEQEEQEQEQERGGIEEKKKEMEMGRRGGETETETIIPPSKGATRKGVPPLPPPPPSIGAAAAAAPSSSTALLVEYDSD